MVQAQLEAEGATPFAAAALIYGVFDMRLLYGCRWDRAS